MSHCIKIYCRTALDTIDHMADTLDLTDYASRIIHPLVRTIDTCPELRTAAMDTLSSLVIQLGRKYQIFIPMVNRVLQKHRINHQRYDVLMCRIVRVRITFNIVVSSEMLYIFVYSQPSFIRTPWGLGNLVRIMNFRISE